MAAGKSDQLQQPLLRIAARKATCTVTVRAVSDIADVITGDFSVMTISDVIGYNVGFILSDAIALDVKESCSEAL